ncbi:MAG: Lrp/AsnC family transcriptional regulator [Burkholderiaceae bacterium]|nr:Lrp/AsnC family transcriptional regulator [Burkholderiaceae bacterium]
MADTNADPTLDRVLIQATQAGLPLLPAPYQALAEQLHTTEQAVIAHFAAMRARGLLRRIGAVPHHVRLGWRANAMTVWDVEDAQADALGQHIGALPFVSHCYRRPRHHPEWPYNLFAMIHAHARADAAPLIEQVAQTLGHTCRAHDVLWSTRVLKKTGLRI